MKIVKLFSGVIALLLILNVIIANQAVDESVQVSRLTREIDSLTQTNITLHQVVSQAGSLTQLKSRIEAAGFIENPQIVSLSASSLASR